MSKGILLGHEQLAELRARFPKNASRSTPTVIVQGRRYPTMPAGDLTVGARVCSLEGHLYTVDSTLDRGVLLVIGPNGAPYRWRRKATTRVPVSWDTYNARKQ